MALYLPSPLLTKEGKNHPARLLNPGRAKRHLIGMVVGGGLGSVPRLAKLFREFLPVEELIPVCEAIIKVFDNHGNRLVSTGTRKRGNVPASLKNDGHTVLSQEPIDEYFKLVVENA